MKTRIRFFSIVFIAALLLAACGGSSSTPTTSTGGADTTPTASDQPGGSGSTDGERTLVVAISSDIQNMDPTLSSGDIITQEVLTAVYSFLIDFELTEQDGQLFGDPDNFVGNVAESFEISEDGTKVTFHLREGIKFSNGDPIDAEAVKFTYDRIFGQGGVTASLTQMAAVDGPESVKVIDEKTVEFTLSTPNNLLFGNMAQFGHSILNPNVVKEHMTDSDPWAHEWLAANTAGTESGPYIIESRDPGNQIVLVRNPNYWGEVKNDKVILKIIPDASSRLAQLRAGAVDIAYDIPTKDLAELENDPSLTIHRNTTRAVTYIGMNNEIEPFNNKLVRQAISYAVPYGTIIDQVLHGYGQQLTSVIPDGTPTHTDEFFVYEEDLEKAKSLLAEAGYPDGFQTVMTIPNDSAEAKEIAVWIQSNLRQIGVEVTIQEMPGAAFTERLQRKEHAFFLHSWTSINNDPFYHAYWLLRSDCCNYARYQNAEINDLIDEYMLSTDAAAREQASIDIQRMVVEDAPWIFLYQPEKVVVTRSDVKGYAFYSADRYVRFPTMYKEGW